MAFEITPEQGKKLALQERERRKHAPIGDASKGTMMEQARANQKPEPRLRDVLAANPANRQLGGMRDAVRDINEMQGGPVTPIPAPQIQTPPTSMGDFMRQPPTTINAKYGKKGSNYSAGNPIKVPLPSEDEF